MTPSITPDLSIASIIAAHPESEAMLAGMGIDSCCGAHATLAEHCDRLRLDVSEVICTLETPRMVLTNRPSTVESLYSQLRELLPRTIELARRVSAAHGARRPELTELEGVVESLVRNIATQVDEAEQRIMPMLRRGSSSDTSHLHELVARVADRSAAHRGLGDSLVRARELTAGFHVPAEACGSWKMLMQTLGSLEKTVLASIHAERNELFPAVMKLAAPVQATASV